MYTSTMATVRLDPSFDKYAAVLAGLEARVKLRSEAASKKVAQRRSVFLELYTDAAAIQGRSAVAVAPVDARRRRELSSHSMRDARHMARVEARFDGPRRALSLS
jgi:hypothetical protein